MPEYTKIKIVEDPAGVMTADQMETLTAGLKCADEATAERAQQAIHVVKASPRSKVTRPAAVRRGTGPEVRVFVRPFPITPLYVKKSILYALIGMHVVMLVVLWTFAIIRFL